MSASSLPFLSFLSGAAALDLTPALFDDHSEKGVTYGDLRRQIPALSALFHADKRNLILGAAPRTCEGATALLGAAASGHALLLVDPDSKRLAPFIAAYEPAWIFSPSASRPSEAYDPVDWPFKKLFLWRRAAPTPQEIHPDLFLLLLPPGPEGSARAVRLSYKNIRSNIEASIEAQNVAPQDRAVLCLPLAYSFGLSVLMNLLAAGGSVILTEQDIKSRSFWELAVAREATLFPGIPFHYDYIAHAGLDHLRAPRIKTFWQAGGRMPIERQRELLKQITARQGSFYLLYGQTETSPRMAALPLHAFPEKLGSVGRPLRGCAFEADEEDEIVFTGPNVMQGYAETRQDLAKGDSRHGRFATGEQGAIDEDGFLFLTGR